MAIAFVQQASTGAQSNFSGATATFGANPTSGHAVVVFIRSYDGTLNSPGTITSISDNLGNTYALIASALTIDPGVFAYVAQNISGGAALTVTINGSCGASSFWWLWVGEYSGVAASVVDSGASGARNQGPGSGDLTSSAITTAGSGEAIVLAAGQNAFTTFTAGTDFTLRNGSLGFSTDHYGGVEDYITASSLSSYTAHIAASTANQATIAWVALKPSGGGATSSLFRQNNLTGIGSGGPFFQNPLTRSMIGWRKKLSGILIPDPVFA